MILTSSGDMGESSENPPDESDAVECVRDDDAESGGVGGETLRAGFPEVNETKGAERIKEQGTHLVLETCAGLE